MDIISLHTARVAAIKEKNSELATAITQFQSYLESILLKPSKTVLTIDYNSHSRFDTSNGLLNFRVKVEYNNRTEIGYVYITNESLGEINTLVKDMELKIKKS